MRNLTLKRTKCFAGCLGIMKVYIEDNEAGDMNINGLLYRQLGKLKNGEEKTFQIDDGELHIAVIADSLSRNYCNDIYKIPAGESDVYLSGRNHLNPATGNAFRFDGTADSEMLGNRRKGNGNGAIIFIAALIVGFVVGGFLVSLLFPGSSGKPKTFSVEGMQITLTDDFSEISSDTFTACYGSDGVAVFVLKESFTLADGFDKNTVEEYGNLVIENNELDSTAQIRETDGLTYFEYQNPGTDGKTYDYIAFVYKSQDAFWMIQFAAAEAEYSSYRQTFIDWAKTVTFVSD